MTTKQKLELLKKWQNTYNELTSIYDDARKLLGASIDSPLMDAIFKSFDGYTDVVAAMVGDSGQWLNWYCYENGMGNKGLHAGLSKRKMKPIKSLEDLVKLLDK